MSLIDDGLAAILVCADCHGSLLEDLVASVLECGQCGLRYAVADGIPNMIVAEATRR